MSSPDHPGEKTERREIQPQFEAVELLKGQSLALYGPDDVCVGILFQHEGQVFIQNNGAASELRPNTSYLLGRNKLQAYKIQDHQLHETGPNRLPDGFFAEEDKKAISRDHFRIFVFEVDQKGGLKIAIKDVSRYARSTEVLRGSSMSIMYDWRTELNPKLIPKSEIPIPQTEPASLRTPRQKIGDTPKTLSLEEDDEIVLETAGSNHIGRLKLSEQGVVIRNDLSDKEALIGKSKAEFLDAKTLGKDFFGPSTPLLENNRYTVRVVSFDAEKMTAEIQLVDKGGTYGLYSSLEITNVEANTEDEKQEIVPKSKGVIEIPDKTAVTLETSSGAHLFYIYKFRNLVVLQNTHTGEAKTLKQGEQFALGTDNPQCDRSFLGANIGHLETRQGGIKVLEISELGAKLEIHNFSKRRVLKMAPGALEPKNIPVYEQIEFLKPDAPVSLDLKPEDMLALYLPPGKEEPAYHFAEIIIEEDGNPYVVTRGGATLLKEGRNVFGRGLLGPQNEHTEKDRRVSRSHLAIFTNKLANGDFKITIRDLHSSNGTMYKLSKQLTRS